MSAAEVIVVGAGASGLLAAGQAALYGARTLLLEKMDQPGRKLLITGKGRCNLTNSVALEDFIPHFGPNGRFLYSAFHQFFNTDLLDLLHGLGVETVTERGGRVFPASGDAAEVVAALIQWVRAMGVTLRTGAAVEAIRVQEGRVTGVRLADGSALGAHAVILTTGGASYPGTGSTGDGYRLAAAVGHTIVPLRPALIPLDTAGTVAARLEGLSLRHVQVTLWIDGWRAASEFGEMVFTRRGVSGPVILTLSKQAVDALRARRRVSLAIDLKPALDEATLDARLLRDLSAYGKRQFQTILKALLPLSLIPVCAELVSIAPEKPAHQLTAAERLRLRAWLKDFRLEVTGHRPLAMAIVTAGGVDLREVDPRTLQSRLVEGLYFAGEVLDLDADTGGYNLQAAFSTGWVAGQSAALAALA